MFVWSVLTCLTRLFYFYTSQKSKAWSETDGEELRNIVTTGGPFAIKMAQLICMHFLFFDKEWAKSLRVLQERCPPRVSPEQIRKILDTNYPNGLLDETFQDIEYVPFAAGSVSQVHRAKLRENGNDVALKIIHPGMYNELRTSFYVTYAASKVFTTLSSTCRRLIKMYDLQNMAWSLYDSLMEQLDLEKEIRSMERFATIVSLTQKLVIPQVYRSLCRSSILVMQYIETVNIAEYVQSHPEKVNFFTQQISMFGYGLTFMFNCVNGDLHLGNIKYMPSEDKLAVFDFGIVYEISEQLKLDFFYYLHAITKGDYELAAECVSSMFFISDDIKAETTREFHNIIQSNLERKDNTLNNRLLEGFMNVLRVRHIPVNKMTHQILMTNSIIALTVSFLGNHANTWQHMEDLIKRFPMPPRQSSNMPSSSDGYKPKIRVPVKKKKQSGITMADQQVPYTKLE